MSCCKLTMFKWVKSTVNVTLAGYSYKQNGWVMKVWHTAVLSISSVNPHGPAHMVLLHHSAESSVLAVSVHRAFITPDREIDESRRLESALFTAFKSVVI